MTTNRALFFNGRPPEAALLCVLSSNETFGTPDFELDPASLSILPIARAILSATSDEAYEHAVHRMIIGWDAAGLGSAQTAADAGRLIGDWCPDPSEHYDEAFYDRCFDHAYAFDDGYVWWWHAGDWHRVRDALSSVSNETRLTTHRQPEVSTAANTHTGLAARAVQAAYAHRAADPDGFHNRHDNWNQWARRARVARTIAAALQVTTDAVLVTDDPHRTYHTRTGPVPGDLITVTDPSTQQKWRFIPDDNTPGIGWQLLGHCLRCAAHIPVGRIATLADLGDHLDRSSTHDHKGHHQC
ncbi:hypothetical protein LWC34_45035 [Kibdelosporangium philippinense]|uniref:Uncharacterized protein n=1 Tax=Kibdelosporangium philippinense TaxID=211113 RepID=A0ABS8ZQR9_9PSEU|nr:hypothetical protein [Kibdelosporangium philippinense]MCE7009924.1 hypothetical protein [Kibdelosporangium philippinense]